MMDKIKVILDCDVGHDDAVALMVAAADPLIDLLGITVVSGNQTLENTLRNTLNVVQHLALNIPVYAGMSIPLVRDRFNAPEIHGKTGLDGPVFEKLHLKEESKHAVDFIIQTLRNSKDKITIVPTGPLTNIAMALRLAPDIKEKISMISLMGGAFGLGNYTPAAEFNIYADPEAAHIVFSSGIKIIMMGLDLTNQTLANMDIIERMESINNKAGKLFGDMLRFTFKSQRLFGLSSGPVHDVTAIAYVIRPDLFEVKDAYVEICLDKGNCYGRSVVDFSGITNKEANALVGVSIKLDEFWDFVEERLRSLN